MTPRCGAAPPHQPCQAMGQRAERSSCPGHAPRSRRLTLAIRRRRDVFAPRESWGDTASQKRKRKQYAAATAVPHSQTFRSPTDALQPEGCGSQPACLDLRRAPDEAEERGSSCAPRPFLSAQVPKNNYLQPPKPPFLYFPFCRSSD